MTFGEKLRQLRKNFDISQDILGEKIGIHGRHIGKYETGKAMPNADTLVRIAKLFNTSIDYLLIDDINNNLSSTPNINDKTLLKEFEVVDKMDEKDKEVIKSLIDAYIKKNQLFELMNK